MNRFSHSSKNVDRFEKLQKEMNDHMNLIRQMSDMISEEKMQMEGQMWSRKTKKEELQASCLSASVYSNETHIEATCLVALTALSSKKNDVWYIDSGCSRHMCGNKEWFITFTNTNISGSVTFGDGGQAGIKGKGTVNTPNISNLENVLYVEGLNTNLLSVSQLTDDFEDVWFNKKKCLVLNNKGNCIMGGVRSVDNCYHVLANDLLDVQTCMKTSSIEEIFTLWHRRLGHVNFQDLLELSNQGIVRGMPKTQW